MLFAVNHELLRAANLCSTCGFPSVFLLWWAGLSNAPASSFPLAKAKPFCPAPRSQQTLTHHPFLFGAWMWTQPSLQQRRGQVITVNNSKLLWLEQLPPITLLPDIKRNPHEEILLRTTLNGTLPLDPNGSPLQKPSQVLERSISVPVSPLA